MTAACSDTSSSSAWPDFAPSHPAPVVDWGVFVHKFRLVDQIYLLAYWPDAPAKTVTLLALGGHEDFYRDLKAYLKA